MKISSSQYDYYDQAYQLKYLLNLQTNSDKVNSNEESASSQSETKTKSSAKISYIMPSEDIDITSLNYSGRMLANSVKMKKDGSSEISGNMEKMKTDMNFIRSADIDNMSSDEVKSTLTKLKNDLESVSKPKEEASNILNADIDSMSDSDIKSMLKKIQDKASSAPDQNQTNKASSMFSKLKEDMESIKTADVDTMSTADVKSNLTKLISDMQSIPSPYGKGNKVPKVDMDTMSDSDMRDMLKKIQNYANKNNTQTQSTGTSDAFSKVKLDIDSIKSKDIDTMSAEDAKKALTQLKTDMQSLPSPKEESSENSIIDTENMSEDDMKEALKKIQEHLNNKPSIDEFKSSLLFSNMDNNEYDIDQPRVENIAE